MGKRFCKIIVACMLTACSAGTYGQAQTINPHLLKRELAPEALRLPSATLHMSKLIEEKGKVEKLHQSVTPSAKIPSNYYIQQFGFVCKKEYQIQKVTRIPLHIRLGSLTHCNLLESK